MHFKHSSIKREKQTYVIYPVLEQLEQKIEGHFIYSKYKFNMQRKFQKGVQLANFAIFSSLAVC